MCNPLQSMPASSSFDRYQIHAESFSVLRCAVPCLIAHRGFSIVSRTLFTLLTLVSLLQSHRVERKCESEISRSKRFAESTLPVPEVLLLCVVSAKPVAVIQVASALCRNYCRCSCLPVQLLGYSSLYYGLWPSVVAHSNPSRLSSCQQNA